MLGHFHDGRGDDFLLLPGQPRAARLGRAHRRPRRQLVKVHERRRDRRADPDRHPPLRRARRWRSPAPPGSAQVEAAVLCGRRGRAGSIPAGGAHGRDRAGLRDLPGEPGRALRRRPHRAGGGRPDRARLRPGRGRARGVGARAVRRQAASLRRARGAARRSWPGCARSTAGRRSSVRVDRLTVTAFGKLSDRELRFGPGLTLVTGSNESGKSTTHAALRAGLFGLTAGGRRKQEETLAIERHRPWCGRPLRLDARAVRRGRPQAAPRVGLRALPVHAPRRRHRRPT